MPTLTRDHTGPYAAPDVDPPFVDDEPEPNYAEIVWWEEQGKERGALDYAARVKVNPYRPGRDVYEDAAHDAWQKTWDAAEDEEWAALPETLTWAEFENACK